MSISLDSGKGRAGSNRSSTRAPIGWLTGEYVDPRDLGPKSPLEDLARAFLQDMRDKGRGVKTLFKYERYLSEMLEFLGRGAKGPRIQDLDLRTLKAYSSHLGRRAPLKGSRDSIGAPTKNLHLIALRGLLRFGVLMDLPVPGPEKVELAKALSPDPDARHLERARIERMLAAVELTSRTGARDRALLELLLATGCRVSEIVGLDRGRVELERSGPVAKDAAGIADEVTVLGKGQRRRKVFLTERAREWLARYLRTRKDRDKALFVTRKRSADGTYRMSVWTAEKIVADAATRAGLSEVVSPHWFRHAAITEWTTKLGLPAAQRLAGHKHISSTNRYLGGSDAELKELYKKRIA